MTLAHAGAWNSVELSFDEPTLTENCRKVLEARYLKKDETGACVESPGRLFRRVAKAVADVECTYGATETERHHWEHRFYHLMTSTAFMPNSPTLMNAGREMGMLSACFVLPVRDSIVDIFNSIKHTALIQKAGGGTGFAFDELRPTGDFISSSGGTTSGPITFWKAFSEATNAIQQGAFRRGANMGMMYIHHPDILKFLHAKQDLSQFTNYNISVKVTDDWMREFLADPDSPHIVRNPRNGKAFVLPRELDIWKYDIRNLPEVACVEPVPANAPERYFRSPRRVGDLPEALRGKVYTKREIWSIIVHNAWQTGEPGVVFIDRINEHNPTPHVGRIEATNPCGEQPLLPYEACNLGSVNLGMFVMHPCTPDAEVDWAGLRDAVHLSTRFLDNVIDANNYPLPEIDQICKANRKIGLGIMGFADALYKLNVAYSSPAGVAWGERLMKFVNDEAHNQSEYLARTRGCFPNWKGSLWHTRHNRLMRNAAVTTVAPTGTISIIANCSGGIEPMFSLAFLRNVLRGQKQGERPLVEANDIFLQVARERGFYSQDLVERIAREGTLAHIDEVPDDIKQVFVCAHDIAPDWHMKMQSAFQHHCDSSISKTINFPQAATEQDVEQIYALAFELKCKGVTVYRDGCRSFQPMALKKDEPAKAAAPEPSTASTNGHTHEAGPPAMRVHAAARAVEPMDLPEIVSGFRIRQMTPFGNMHVKITVDPRSQRELEIFAQLGKGGDVANSDLEGMCRAGSLWLRSGGSLRHLIKQWDGIGSSLQIPTRAGRIMSLPHGLACALKKYLRAKEYFGLRALLLGEVDLSALDSAQQLPNTDRLPTPDEAPARALAASAPPVSVAGGPKPNGPNNPGAANGGGPAGGAANGGAAHNRIAESVGGRLGSALRAVEGGEDAARSSRAAQPRTQMLADGGAVHGSEAGGATALAERAHDTTAIEVCVHDDAADATIAEFHVDAELATEADEALAVSVTTSVRQSHDSAQGYKVRCPQCEAVLAMQEGCKKCQACGWAAC
ncbi:MAG: adenosylcobalamin-dependent ribonucleoside-diphosphate reductase [Phycisphaerae bacterium]